MKRNISIKPVKPSKVPGTRWDFGLPRVVELFFLALAAFLIIQILVKAWKVK